MRRFPILHVEMHIHHRCDLNCAGCAHYCDLGYGGSVPFEQGGAWMRQWAQRLDPVSFHLLGGEPLLSREADKYLRCARDCFPNAQRSFATNGILLITRPELIDVLIETDTTLRVSLHNTYTPQQQEMLNQSLLLAQQAMDKGLKVCLNDSATNWARLHQGDGTAMRPFAHGDDDTAFARCIIGTSNIIHDGKLWKCPPLAFLPQVADRLEHREQWERYLHYEPLAPDAPDEALLSFIRGESSCCDMCPLHAENISTGGVPARVMEGVHMEVTEE